MLTIEKPKRERPRKILDYRYEEFLASKAIVSQSSGFVKVPDLNPVLFDFQRDIVKFSLRRGRAAIFAMTGLGKTPMQVEWAKHVSTNGNVLILAPLAVNEQTVQIARDLLSVDVIHAEQDSDVTGENGIYITNYQKLHRFDAKRFVGIALDESSIIKHQDAKTRDLLIETFAQTPWKLCCTATPAPNDYMELGNHAEFLNVMRMTEMLSMFFVHDGGETQKWRLKGHAADAFWKWVASWAVSITKPSDLGYSDAGFDLPPLHYHVHRVTGQYDVNNGYLFAMPAISLDDFRSAKRGSLDERCAFAYELIDADRKREEARIQQGIPSKKEGGTKRTGAKVVSGEQRKNRQDAPQEIHGGVSKSQSREVEKNPGSTGKDKSDKEGEVCCVREDTGILQSSSTAICKEESIHGETPEIEEIQPNNRGVRSDDGKSKSSVLHLSSIQSGSQTVSHDRPLPQNRESKGNTLQQLQSVHRENEGQSDTTQSGCGISGKKWLVWTELNSEQARLEGMARPCNSIQGSDSDEDKIRMEKEWRDGSVDLIITKASIFGQGLNWQHCHNMIFLSISHSWERFFQAVRRCYRFGQKSPVNVHIIISDLEEAMLKDLWRKEKDAQTMSAKMIECVKEETKKQLKGVNNQKSEYKTRVESGKGWTAYMGDCVETVGNLESNTVDYSVFSPPFSSLYTYSNSDRDMGNCTGDDQFETHFRFLVHQLFRVIKPGREVSFHCMNLPTSKQHHGYIGIRDFRGELIRMFIDSGFIYHSEVCIWKDPVTAMQRTKAIGLLHKQLKKDSCISRQGIPDYLVTMRKPGENPSPVKHTNDTFPVSKWQKMASPVWMDINPSDTLQFRSAREHNDERHICCLQLEVIRRALRLWTNPNDLVLSPFMGIGSEGYVALEEGRRFVGVELKESYYKQSVANLKSKSEETRLL